MPFVFLLHIPPLFTPSWGRIDHDDVKNSYFEGSYFFKEGRVNYHEISFRLKSGDLHFPLHELFTLSLPPTYIKEQKSH